MKKLYLGLLCLGLPATIVAIFYFFSEKGEEGYLADKYNVILISLDTLRADRVGCYGYPRPVSPTIDSLATRGVRFANTIALSSWTLPSHMTIFTGLFPSTHGVTLPVHKLSPKIETLTQVFQKNGYRTYANTEGAFVDSQYGFDRGFENYDTRRKTFNETIEQAKAWILNKPEEELYFMFLHTFDIHCPYDPPEKYSSMFQQRPSEDHIDTREKCGNPEYNQMDLTPGQVKYLSDKYDAGIRFADDCLKSFITFLEERNAFKDTILVILSDHGEEFKEHGQIGHERTLYIESLIVPFIIVAPTLNPKVVLERVSLETVMPTILEMTGISCPPVQGTSLLQQMGQSQTEPVEKPAFSELDRHVRLRSVIKGTNHLLVNMDNNKKELYDISKDSREQVNIIDSKPELVSELKTLLRGYLKDVKSRHQPEYINLSPEQKRVLRSLGYIN